ncbi:MAG: hypothetical protein AAFR27_10430, partial [Pseudomonadota bacterium]
MLMIAIVLIVVIGPKDAITMMKSASQSLKSARKMLGDMQRQFNDALDEADLGDIKNVANEMRELDPRRQIKDAFKPLEDVGKDIAGDFGDGADEIEAPAMARSSVDSSMDDAGAKMRAAQTEIKPKAIVSLDDAAPVKKPAAKKPAAKKPAAKTATTKKPAAKKAPARSSATKTASAKAASAKKPATTRKPAAKKPAAKTSTGASKTAAKAPGKASAGDKA